MHGPGESKPHYTEQGVRHQSKNNAVSPSRLFVRGGQPVDGAACCWSKKLVLALVGDRTNRVRKKRRTETFSSFAGRS